MSFFSILFVCILFLLPALGISDTTERTDAVAHQAVTNKQELKENIKKLREQVQNLSKRQVAIESKVKTVQDNLYVTRGKTGKISSIITLFEWLETGISSLLFPVSWFFSKLLNYSSILLLIFFPVTLLNIFIYLFYKEKTFFEQRKILIISIFAGLLLMFLSGSAFAQEGNSRTHIGFHKDLKETANILKTHGSQRYIGILERMPFRTIQIPYIEIPGNQLYIIKEVRAETIEYYFSLGALYLASHQQDKAVMSIESMYLDHVLPQKIAFEETANILMNGVKFLLEQGRTGKASKAWKAIYMKINDIQQLLQMYDYFEKNGHPDLAKLSFDRAGLIAKQPDEILTFASLLFKQGFHKRGENALVAAASASRSIEEIERIIDVAIEQDKKDVIFKLAKRDIFTGRKIKDSMRIIDFLLKRQQTEAAESLFSMVINTTLPESEAELLSLMDLAVERSFYKEALVVVEKLAIFLGESAEKYEIPPPAAISSDEQALKSDKVLLQTVYGVLYEKLGSMTKAKKAYIGAVSNRIRQITNTYGYQVPIRIKDYLHLRQLLNKTGDTETLSLLEPIYQHMKSSVVKKSVKSADKPYDLGVSERDELQASLKKLNQKIENLEQEFTDKNERLKRERNELRGLRVKLFFKFLRIISIILLLSILIAGAVYKAWQYSKTSASLRTFGFLAKFLECIGWIKTMTVIGALIGIIEVFVGQIMLLFHRLQQDTEAIKRQNQSIKDK